MTRDENVVTMNFRYIDPTDDVDGVVVENG
jgi:hypothetical protein